jgi:hypothetical protein
MKKRKATPIREEDRLFWIERFGRAGAIELGRAIWGPPQTHAHATLAPMAGTSLEVDEYLAASGYEQ